MIGIDIVALRRIQGVFVRYKERFLRRFLTSQEIKLLQSRHYKIESVAGFWAAKEACSKALGVGISKELGFLDIHITYSERNAPILSLSQEKLAYFNIQTLSLSISHDGGFVIAAVIAH